MDKTALLKLTLEFLPCRSSVRTLVWYTQALHQTQRLNYPLHSGFHAKFFPQQRPTGLLPRRLGVEERDVLHETHAHVQDRVLLHRGCEMAPGVVVMRRAGGEGEGPLQRK